MPELSEVYVTLRGEVQGKRRLNADEVNPLLRQYRQLLGKFKIEKKKDDGGKFQVAADHTDEFNSELLSDKILVFSHKLKLNIYDSYPHGFDNYAHHIQVEIWKGLEKIQVDNRMPYSKKIVVLTTGIQFPGGGKTAGRWPTEEIQVIGF